MQTIQKKESLLNNAYTSLLKDSLTLSLEQQLYVSKVAAVANGNLLTLINDCQRLTNNAAYPESQKQPFMPIDEFSYIIGHLWRSYAINELLKGNSYKNWVDCWKCFSAQFLKTPDGFIKKWFFALSYDDQGFEKKYLCSIFIKPDTTVNELTDAIACDKTHDEKYPIECGKSVGFKYEFEI